MAHKGKKHTNISAQETARRIRERNNQTRAAIDPKKKPAKKKSTPRKSQTISRYKKDFDNLKSASKSQIEEIRKALRAGKKVKVKRIK